ncbi:MFS transporter [Candidatus Bathyarchaeota archaeon]|nr:MFS transporter [Candidatus Bathyarchaeota archaeon]
MNQVKNVFLIQALNSFVGGVLGVAVPLMMKARNVDVVVIGFVFASMPLIMQLGRMFFATISDFWGRKLFFVSNGVLGIISGLIYYAAHSPLEFLFGKVMEGTKEGSLWAVNRAFLLEKNGGHWGILVYLRTVAYVAYALGGLIAGFLIVWFLFEGTMLICALFSLFVLTLALLLATEKRGQFSITKALRFLDFRKKTRTFKIFLFLFFVMGVSFGFVGGFVIPLFLDAVGFEAEGIGLVFGMEILVAGLFSYLFAKSSKMRELILLSGVLFSITLFLLGFTSWILAAALVIFFGFVQGMASIGQEGILSKVTDKESYGTDIGLLMMGLHLGETLSLALSGVLIALWGFVAPFMLAASTYTLFYIGAYILLKE